MCRLSWPAVAARGRRGAGCFFYTDRRWCVRFLASDAAEMLTYLRSAAIAAVSGRWARWRCLLAVKWCGSSSPAAFSGLIRGPAGPKDYRVVAPLLPAPSRRFPDGVLACRVRGVAGDVQVLEVDLIVFLRSFPSLQLLYFLFFEGLYVIWPPPALMKAVCRCFAPISVKKNGMRYWPIQTAGFPSKKSNGWISFFFWFRS
jgi:hypothetical protein